MESSAPTSVKRAQHSILLSWLWMSLVVGVLAIAGVIATGIDYGNAAYQFPLAAVEVVIAGVPVGAVFGAIVYGIVVLVWALSRRSLTPRSQRIVYPVAALLSSGTLFYVVFSLFPIVFPLVLFAVIVSLCFAAIYFLTTCRRT
jgi:hypothetical protein